MVERRVTILTQLVDRISKPLDQISKNFSQVNASAEAASASFQKVTVSARPIAAGLKNAGRAAATTVVGLTGVAAAGAAASAGVGAVAATTVAGAGGLATLAGSAAPVVDNLGQIGERSKTASTDLAAIGTRGIETAGKLGTLTQSLKVVGLNIRAAFVERGRAVEFDLAIERRAELFLKIKPAVEAAAEAQRALNRQTDKEIGTTASAIASQEKALASRKVEVKLAEKAVKEATAAERAAAKEVNRLTAEFELFGKAQAKATADAERVTAAVKPMARAIREGAEANDFLGRTTRQSRAGLKGVEEQAKRTQTTFSKLLKTLKPLIAGFAGIALVRRSFAAAQKQATAEAALFQALRGNVQEFEKLSALAKEIQSRTVVGDEEVLNILALLANAEVGFDRLGVSIEAIVQASAALQKPLDTIATQLLQTLAGEIPRTLKALVPALENLTKAELAAGDAFVVIASSLGGAAEAIARTPFGEFEQTANRLGDQLERLGDVLVGVVNPAIETVTDAVEGLTGAFDGLISPETQEGLGDLSSGFVKLVAEVAVLSGGLLLAVKAIKGIRAASIAALGATAGLTAGIGVAFAAATLLIKILELQRDQERRDAAVRAKSTVAATQARQRERERLERAIDARIGKNRLALENELNRILGNTNQAAQDRILAQANARLDRQLDLERITAAQVLEIRRELDEEATAFSLFEAKRRAAELRAAEETRLRETPPRGIFDPRAEEDARAEFLTNLAKVSREIQNLQLQQNEAAARLVEQRTQFARDELQTATDLQANFRAELAQTNALVEAGTITIGQGLDRTAAAGASVETALEGVQDRIIDLFSGEGVDIEELQSRVDQLNEIIIAADAATDAQQAAFAAAQIKRDQELSDARFRLGEIRLNQNAEIQSGLVALEEARIDRLVELDRITPGEASADRQRLALQLVNAEIAAQEAVLLRLSQTQAVTDAQRTEQVERQTVAELALQQATVSRQQILVELSNQRSQGFQAEIEGATEALEALAKLQADLQKQIEAGELTVVEAQVRQAAAVEVFRLAVTAANEELRRLGSGEAIDPVEFDRRIAELSAILQEGLVEKGFEPVKVEIQSLGEFLVENLEAPLTGLFSDLVSGTKSVRNAFADMLSAMADQIAKFLIQQAVQGLLGLLGGTGVGKVGFSLLSRNEGGIVPARLAEGGTVPGGGPNVDSIPAMLTPGEFVMRRSAVQHYGASVMEGINRMVVPSDLIRHFRAVGRTPSPSGGFQRGGEVADEVVRASTPQVLPVMVAEPATVERFLRGGAAGLMRVLSENADELSSITQAARGSV